MKQIIILDRKTDTERLSFEYLLWAPVPAGREPVWQGQNSEIYTGATPAEVTALNDGAVAQKHDVYSKAPGTTIQEVQSDLIDEWNKFNDFVQSHNPKARYGTSWDGTSWTMGGIS